MANTIVVKDLLQKEVIRKLDKNRVISAWANTKYQGDLREQGDTVTVQTFPDLVPTLGGTAGDDITTTDWAITSENLQVAQVAQDSRKVKNIEEVRSNLALRSQIADRFAYALAQTHERHVGITAVQNVNSSNAINAGAPADLTASTVYAAVEAMRQKLSQQNSFGNAALFVNPETASFIRQSGLFDGFVEGLVARKGSAIATMNGLMGELAGFTIYETNNLPYKVDLEMATQPTADDTITIGVTDIDGTSTDVVITFKATASAAGECDLGANVAATQANLVAMINGTGTGDGTDYFEFTAAQRGLLNRAEANLGAFSSDVAALTLNNEGTVAETFTDATDTWGTPALVLFGIDREAVNFVDQMTKFKVNPATSNGGFYDLVQYESAYQGGVLGDNDKRIVTSEIQLPA